MTNDKKSLMRSLGEFAGPIIKGVRTPAEPERLEVRREVRETTRDGMTLRRTVIEEVQLPDDGASSEIDDKDEQTCS